MKKIIVFSLMVLIASLQAFAVNAAGGGHGHRAYVKHSKHHKVHKVHRPHGILDETYR